MEMPRMLPNSLWHLRPRASLPKLDDIARFNGHGTE